MARITEQRTAIRDVLLASGRPLSAEEILAGARRTVPALGIATVYRNIRRLSDEGWLVEVDIPGGPVRYEVAGKGHHHHFVCETCDRAFLVPTCASDLRKMTPKGYKLNRHEVLLYGECSDCRKSSGR